MYFDGFTSRPFSRLYYDSGVVTFLTAYEVRSAESGSFRMLHTVRGFRREALVELAGQTDRDRYNLPVRVDHPESLGEVCVYLPVYVVRAVGKDQRVRYLAYSQAADVADSELGALCERTPEILGVLNSEGSSCPPEKQRAEVANWLEPRNLSQCRPVPTGHGAWQVILPAAAFGPTGAVPLAKLGSYVVLDSTLLSIRCDDTAIRERALIERIDAVVRPRAKAVAVSARIVRVAGQLGLQPIGVTGIREIALRMGRRGLVARLDALAATTGPAGD
jgi:hypothetical protein